MRHTACLIAHLAPRTTTTSLTTFNITPHLTLDCCAQAPGRSRHQGVRALRPLLPLGRRGGVEGEVGDVGGAAGVLRPLTRAPVQRVVRA